MHKPDPADRHALHVVPGLLPESRISPPLKRVSVPVPSRRAASPFNMRSRGSHTTPVREMLPLYEPWCLGQVIGRVIVGRARVAPVQSIKKNLYYFWGGTNLIMRGWVVEEQFLPIFVTVHLERVDVSRDSLSEKL